MLPAVHATAADPRLSSWFTTESARYARVRETDAAGAAGATTWTGQTTPAYAGVQELAYDASYIYVRSYGLAGYVMGPWYLNAARSQLFPNRPVATARYRRISRNPAPAASKTATGLGTIGMYVNGVSLFDNRDAFYWNGTAEANGNGYWNRDAWVNEGITFDYGFAHQEQTGNYHYHAFPPALRYQLGDNISYNPATFRYAEQTNNLHHSPILAWVADSFPIYGPYGYSNATNPASPVRRIVSGFVRRDGNSGTDNIAASGRGTIPAWAQRAYGVGPSPLAGPAVSTTYPLGRYLEDNAYLGDLINAATGTNYQLGVNFDLNEYNVRWCITPEFPNGTWAYFCTLGSDGNPAFPYALGRQYWGTPDNAALAAIPAAATNYFKGGPDLPSTMNAPARAGNDVVLTWSSLEGGTYRLEASTHIAPANWVVVNTNIVATGMIATVTATNSAAGTTRYFRAARTALANYFGGTNSGGGTGAVAPGGSASRGTTVTVTITLPTTPPPPPANLVPTSVTLAGTIPGTSISRPAAGTVLATFVIPANAPTGAQNIVVTFNPAPTYTMTGAFTLN